MIRVFLADDHAVVRVGLRHLLTDLGDVQVVGEAADGRQVLNARALDRCDVLILDLSLPVVGGTEVLRRLRAARPHLPVVVHSMYPEEQFAHRALALGAAAYVSKERPPAELVAAVRLAAAGATGLRGGPPEPAAAPAPPHAALTPREHQVFMRIVSGGAVADIAAELDVHSCTVSNHLASIRRKLGAPTVAALVAYAFAEGLLPGPPGA